MSGRPSPFKSPTTSELRVHAPVLDVPAFRLAPAVRAPVVNDFEVFRVAVKNEVRPAIAVEVGHRQRGDALVRGNGINAEARVGRQFVDFQFARRFAAGWFVLPVWL